MLHLPPATRSLRTLLPTMPTGTMLRWNERGFGFIRPDDGGEDLFCHSKSLLDGDGSVQEGDRCRYKVDFDDRKGKDHAVQCERAMAVFRRATGAGTKSTLTTA